MIKISFQNSGGELDSKQVESPVESAQAMIDMIQSAGEIFGGDKFIVTESDEN